MWKWRTAVLALAPALGLIWAKDLTVEGLIDGCIKAWGEIQCLLLSFGLDMATMMLEWLDEFLPDSLQSGLAGFAYFYQVANPVFPLDTMFTLFGLYWVFAGALTSYRVVKSWIPAMGS